MKFFDGWKLDCLGVVSTLGVARSGRFRVGSLLHVMGRSASLASEQLDDQRERTVLAAVAPASLSKDSQN